MTFQLHGECVCFKSFDMLLYEGSFFHKMKHKHGLNHWYAAVFYNKQLIELIAFNNLK